MSALAPPVCARCVARGTGCCEPAEGIAGPPLTPGDLRRIRAATGLPEGEFTVSREVDEEERAAWEEEDPALRGIVAGGRVVSLGRRGRACVFLGEGGCTLPLTARPLACRRFPLVRIGSQLEVRPAGECLAVEEAGDLAQLLTSLGTSRREQRDLDRTLRAELTPRQPRANPGDAENSPDSNSSNG